MTTFEDYQREARKFAVYPGLGGNLWYPALGLGGEAGEVLEHVKKLHRDDFGHLSAERQEAIARELGDVLWYVANLATEANLDLGSIAQGNLAKLADRKKRGQIHGSGDAR